MKITLEVLVRELQGLRIAHDAARAALFNRAHQIEVGHADLWKGAGFASFDGFLRHYDICESPLYRDYIGAMKIQEIAKVSSTIGVHATAAAGQIANKGRREKYIQTAVMRFERDGVPWSSKEARSQAQSIAGTPPKDSNMNKLATEQERLHAEVVDLRKKLQAAEREVRALTEENEKLKRKLGSKKTVSGVGGRQPTA
jgi:outer membrane murein-binding lipoprotein Lpp